MQDVHKANLKERELITVFGDPRSRVTFLSRALSSQEGTFAVGTSYYFGVNGKEGDPPCGRVQLFRTRAK